MLRVFPDRSRSQDLILSISPILLALYERVAVEGTP